MISPGSAATYSAASTPTVAFLLTHWLFVRPMKNPFGWVHGRGRSKPEQMACDNRNPCERVRLFKLSRFYTRPVFFTGTAMLKHEFENVNVFPSFHIISYQRLYLPFKGGFKGSFSRVSEGVKKRSINSQK